MNNELIHEYRGDIPENIFYGQITVVNDKKEIIGSVGDPTQYTYYRSAAKPIQTLPILMYNLDKQYGLTSSEVAIMSGSHAGEDYHVTAIESLLKKGGFSEDDLVLPPSYPAYKPAYDHMIKNDLPPRKVIHNCAAKHIALMMLERHLGGDYRSYANKDSLSQRCVIKVIADMAEVSVDKIKTGIDGCGVLVYALPSRDIAVSELNLACPDRLFDKAMAEAVVQNEQYIHQNPLYMRGTGFPCAIMNLDQNIVAKGGADGVYGFGLKRERIGVFLKIADGSESNWPIIIAEILRQLGYKGEDTFKRLEGLREPFKRNCMGENIGEIKPVFSLK